MWLIGRKDERATLDALLARAGRGRSASLVLRGEAGVGKTALLTYAVSTTPESLCLSGIESEAGFPFAALHRLLIPLLPQRDRLPAGQRAAIEVACGPADGCPPDLYLVGLAALTLLAGSPRLCVVDDAQWLDQESLRSLAFVARRLHADGVVLLFGLRGPGHRDLSGIPALDVAGLTREAAVTLLTAVVDGPIDRLVAVSIADATGGNPRALTDLGRELTAAQLTGGTPLPEPMPIGSRLEATYLARVRGCPPATRTRLLLAAADPGGDPGRLAVAGATLGVGPDDAGPAETDRLVAGEGSITFRHPLVRSAVYNGASATERRRVHRALAEATTDPQDADQRAWHRAAAATGPDEPTAAELGTTQREIARAFPAAGPPTLPGLLLTAYATFFDGGYSLAGPHLRRAAEAMAGPEADDRDVLRHFVLGVTFCMLTWDDVNRRAILRRVEAHARATGALPMLDLVTFLTAMTEISFGRLTEADRYEAIGRRIRESIGATTDQEQVRRHPELLAWRAADGAHEALEQILPASEALGLGAMVSITRQSLALVAVGRGDYAGALAQLARLVELGTPGLYARVLPDLVECALRAGDRRTAELACADLEVAVRCSGTPWAEGLLARSRALLAAGDVAEPLYRQAVELLSGTLAQGDLARARLLYGEWLRRRRRRGDAREQLAEALRLFEAERAEAFVERVRRELDALGASTRIPVRANGTALTPQEAAVARLARAGGTNAEIAAHLYLSASTVDYHLRKVYRKLGVRSRRQLGESLHD